MVSVYNLPLHNAAMSSFKWLNSLGKALSLTDNTGMHSSFQNICIETQHAVFQTLPIFKASLRF